MKNKVDFTPILQSIFLFLKLSGKVSWSWAVVFIPTWIATALFALCLVLSIVAHVIHKGEKK